METPEIISNQPEFTVSSLSDAIKHTMEDAFAWVRVRGEISGFKRAASGHLYLNLKDDNAVLNAVCWRGVASHLPAALEDGLEIIASGKITTYGGRSNYQLVIERVELAGIGALMALLEKRKQQLTAEGLFAAERKKRLPYLPRTIGIITSPTGAVIRDMLHRLQDRCGAHVLLWPVLVQGEGAATQITRAVEGFNSEHFAKHFPVPDVLIVARGGGSLEDLWAFNEENVVRAVAASRIPVISAVGHETDTTLCDFAADVRAPTPTAAAEFAVPVKLDLLTQLRDYQRRMLHALQRHVETRTQMLGALSRGLISPQQSLHMRMQRLDDLTERLRAAPLQRVQFAAQRLQMLRMPAASVRAQWQRMQDRLEAKAQLLESYHYKKVLARGFAMVRNAADGTPITRAEMAKQTPQLQIEFADGVVETGSANTSQPTVILSNAKDLKSSTPRKKKIATTTQVGLFD